MAVREEGVGGMCVVCEVYERRGTVMKQGKARTSTKRGMVPCCVDELSDLRS